MEPDTDFRARYSNLPTLLGGGELDGGREAEALTTSNHLVHLRLFEKLLDGCSVDSIKEQ